MSQASRFSGEVWSRRLNLPVFGLCTALFAAGHTAALGHEREADLEMGARLVEARCVFCHNEKSLPDLVDRCTRKHGASYLDDFLKRHHAPDDQARADIIAYLTCQAILLPKE